MNKHKCITAAKKHKFTPKNKITDELVTIALICDTYGYRMKSYGPSPLLQFKNKKLIDLQIAAIKNTFNNFEIILSTGYDTDKICKYIKTKYKNINIRIVENQLFNTSNSCESIRLILNNTNNDKILICDGSLLFTSDTLKLLKYDQSYIYIEESPQVNMAIGVNVNEFNYIEHFSFGASKPWSEILFLHNFDMIENFRKLISDSDYKNKFIFEGLNEFIKYNNHINCIINKHIIYKINNIKTYHSVKENY